MTGGPVTPLLAQLRASRAIAPDELLAAKVGRCVGWFAREGLDAAIVGVSGGIDSAVVLGLLEAVRRAPGSPLRRVVACIIPVEGPGGTGQRDAELRARAVVERFGSEAWVVPLAAAHAATVAALEAGSGRTLDGWTAGQLLSVERTPVLYGAAAVLQSDGHRSVVVGTTNRDEGAYLGFFGKASDGAVDLQAISDLHKSEVRALAGLLGVPECVTSALPSGDVWDGRTDAEMIGADYDDVETVLRLRELGWDPQVVAARTGDERLGRVVEAVERLHAVNAHKYRVGSPAVHLDVLHRGVPGGWSDEVLTGRQEHPPAASLPGRWDPPPVRLCEPAGLPAVDRRPDLVVGHDVLGVDDRAALCAALADAPSAPVGVTGLPGTEGTGSWRSTAFAPELADQLWRHVASLVPSVLVCEPTDATDAHRTEDRTGHRTWRSVGLSPLLRFMRYSAGGRHYGHYDAGFDYGDGRRTLWSVVCFLRSDGEGGALRFLEDHQGGLPVWERDHTDWAREATPDEVVASVVPRAGTVVAFPHRRCHDVDTWLGPGDRIVIRADVVYERIPDGRGLG